MQGNRLPLVPEYILKAHKVNEPSDSRFMAAARLLQALWREEKALPIGVHRNPHGKRRKLGSRLDDECGKQGRNFLTPEIAKLAFRESVYREIGAMIDQERLWTNMLSSQPLCFNLFGGLKLDVDKANRFFRHLLPDFVASVEGVYFEHSPGRGNPAYTDDHTAFDVFVTCTTLAGHKGFIAIEVKYSESMSEPPATMRPRYEELTGMVGVFREPAAHALRGNPLQQLWREHMLSRVMIDSGLYDQGRFIVIYPAQNNNCAAAVNAYSTHLSSDDPVVSGFQSVTLETCLDTLRAIGDDGTATALQERYLDFGKVEAAIFSG
jgi:hypothetical protein